MTTHQVQSVKSTKPQIEHTNSLQSSSAGYLSDYASDESSSKSLNGYSTPPSRMSTPVVHAHQQSNMPPRPALAIPDTRTNIQNDSSHPLDPARSSAAGRFSPPTPGVDDTPYIRFAIEQLTFDEELMGRGRHSSEFGGALPTRQTTQPDAPRQDMSTPRATQPPKKPFQFPRSSQEQQRTSRTGATILLPADPPHDRHQLGYVPLALRPLTLAILLFLCLLMIAGLVFSNIYALTNHGLYDYNGNNTIIYFLFEYLPPILSMIIIFWLFTIQAAIYRILPYITMSSKVGNSKQTRLLQTMPIIPANFVLPDYRFFKLGQPLIGAVLVIFWLMNWTVPLLSCLYGTQWFTNLSGRDRFRWTPVQGLGWFLVVMYLLLIPAIVYCMIRFRRRSSSLMWDPTSLADFIILFQRSNLLSDYMRTEVEEDLSSSLPQRVCRLGYWTTSQSQEPFYALGESNSPYINMSPAQGQFSNEKQSANARQSGQSERGPLRDSQESSFSKILHSPFVKSRWVPWFLTDSRVLAWAIAAFLLLVAFLVVSFLKQAVRRGWDPLLASTTQSNGFSPANFLYSFIPSLLGMFLFLAWQPIDVYFRAVQPFASMSHADGATAKRSILLAYNSKLPIVVTLSALRNGHLKVAWISFVSLVAATIPILAGGVFTAIFFANANQVRMVASMPGYLALCVFLSLYALSYAVIWPTRKRYLPHSIDTIAGNLSFLYVSRLLKDSSIRNIRNKADFIERLEGNTNSGLTGDRRARRARMEKFLDSQTRYGFGFFTGIDGQEHLGIDRMSRPGSGEILVDTSYAGHSAQAE